MKKVIFFGYTMLIFMSCVQKDSNSAKSPFNMDEYRASLKFLSDDKLLGRLPGSHGGDIAAQYIASRFESYHLRPFSTETGYLQSVTIESFRPDYKSAHIIISGKDFQETIKPFDEVLLNSSENKEEINIKGELIFVGYGAIAPEYDWDDYKDVAIKDKIVVCLVNHPDFQKGYAQGNTTYYGSWEYKTQKAFEKGARGILIIYQGNALFPFSAWRNYAAYPSSGDYSLLSKIPLVSYITEEAFDRVLKRTDLSTRDLVKQAKQKDFKPFSLSLHLEADFRQNITEFKSPNVIGVVQGTKKPVEAIVFMAHYDHLGTLKQEKGDSIYNGAIDNASGVAGIITLAEYFSKNPAKRTVIFLATTAEEMNFQGTHQYLNNPLIPLEKTIIGINLDMMNFMGLKDSIELAPLPYTNAIEQVRQIAQNMNIGLKLTDFDNAYMNFRVESYPFALKDILTMNLAFEKIDGHYPSLTETELKEIINSGRLNYHEPSDEIKPWFRYEGIIQGLELAKNIGIYYANDGIKPKFNDNNPYLPAKELWANE